LAASEPQRRALDRVLGLCDDNPAELCLDDQPLVAEVAVEKYAYLVDSKVTVTYRFDDQAQTWIVTGIGPVA
jgi:hypothetical protein